ncbi:hypothetical protein [Pseudoalteromonas sp. BDTF-M6]|uniref:hypothetical protein n=1 Tax=Pseudoalteromonas sp. BDTF-M6 TaxID=2796132 RepID=UPI001BAE81AF|nr:hypothetical protein [Pseudoalteromonas sp. BDTF-M6]MBS3798066.1 hypothetical protein [Pseudoalteromonas sp. BDTF-M6]
MFNLSKNKFNSKLPQVFIALVLISSTQLKPPAYAQEQSNQGAQSPQHHAKDFDPNRRSNFQKRKHFKFDVSQFKKIDRKDVPKNVPLVADLPVYELPLQSSASTLDYHIFKLGGELRKNLTASVSEPVPGTGVLPTSLYVQYDPMINMGLRVTWEQGSGFYYGIRLQIDGVPVEENPPIAMDDPEFIYFGQGAGFSIEPAVAGNYAFELVTFDEYYDYISYLSASPLSVTPYSYFFPAPPYEPESLYRGDSISIDPDGVGNSGDEFDITAQLVLKWDQYQGWV